MSFQSHLTHLFDTTLKSLSPTTFSQHEKIFSLIHTSIHFKQLISSVPVTKLSTLQYIPIHNTLLKFHSQNSPFFTPIKQKYPLFTTVPRKCALFFHRLSILERATDHGCINSCNHPKEMWVGSKCNGLVNFFSERRYFKQSTCVFPPCPPPPHPPSSFISSPWRPPPPPSKLRCC